MSSACPVPTATTFTAMPVLPVNRGSRKPNSPDCSVEVVEATIIDGCCAKAGPARMNARIAAGARRRGFMVLSSTAYDQYHEADRPSRKAKRRPAKAAFPFIGCCSIELFNDPALARLHDIGAVVAVNVA